MKPEITIYYHECKKASEPSYAYFNIDGKELAGLNGSEIANSGEDLEKRIGELAQNNSGLRVRNRIPFVDIPEATLLEVNYGDFINQLNSFKTEMNLNDWGYYLLVKKSAKAITTDENAQLFLEWFLLTKSAIKSSGVGSRLIITSEAPYSLALFGIDAAGSTTRVEPKTIMRSEARAHSMDFRRTVASSDWPNEMVLGLRSPPQS